MFSLALGNIKYFNVMMISPFDLLYTSTCKYRISECPECLGGSNLSESERVVGPRVDPDARSRYVCGPPTGYPHFPAAQLSTPLGGPEYRV